MPQNPNPSAHPRTESPLHTEFKTLARAEIPGVLPGDAEPPNSVPQKDQEALTWLEQNRERFTGPAPFNSLSRSTRETLPTPQVPGRIKLPLWSLPEMVNIKNLAKHFMQTTLFNLPNSLRADFTPLWKMRKLRLRKVK